MRRIALCLLLLCAISSADDYGAVVNRVSGTVQALKKSAQEWAAVSQGNIFSSGDIIKTFADGACEVYLIDGTIFEIGPNSLLKIDDIHGEDSFLKRAIFDLEIGELLSEIEPGLDYRVRTPQAVCAVRGTKFAVKAADDSQVAVFSGKVGVRHYGKDGKLSKRAQTVKRMQEARVRLYSKPQLSKKLSGDMQKTRARMSKEQNRRKELRKKIIKDQKELRKARSQRIIESRDKQQKGLIEERRERKAPVRRTR